MVFGGKIFGFPRPIPDVVAPDEKFVAGHAAEGGEFCSVQAQEIDVGRCGLPTLAWERMKLPARRRFIGDGIYRNAACLHGGHQESAGLPHAEFCAQIPDYIHWMMHEAGRISHDVCSKVRRQETFGKLQLI